MNKDSVLKFTLYSLIISSFIYVFTGITGINLPGYYPVLRKWSVAPIKDAISMGFYSKVFFTLIVSGILSYLLKLFTKSKDIDIETLIGFTKASVIFAIFFFIGEEWHKWGTEKMKLDTPSFVNREFWLLVIITILFIISTIYATIKGHKEGK